MSNIFFASSLIFLASKEAGCIDKDDLVIEDCSNEVHGYKPTSFVSTIAVISGVLSALFMPVAGAMMDYTAYRKQVGVTVASLIILIQIIQIGTNSNTWFAMAILQAFSGFLYQVQVLVSYAYITDIAGIVGEEKMTRRTLTKICWIDNGTEICLYLLTDLICCV